MARSCGAVQNYFRQLDLYPELRRNQAALAEATESALEAESRRVPQKPISVVVHVLYRVVADNVSDEQVASQIEVLNEDYSATNADLADVPEPFQDVVGNPQLSFELASTDPDGNPTTGITRTRTKVSRFPIDDTMKAAATGGADAWDTQRYLNLWVCRLAEPTLGYAQFPGGPADTDGVVITTTAFGRNGTADAPFHLGRTATHEIGHYLNLSHIWGESRVPSCTDSDDVADTPNHLGPNQGRPTFPHTSCGNTPNGDMFMNYMDYVDDDAMFMFTDQQVERMLAALQFSRSKLGRTARERVA
jgi:hypothetical protein